jgi:2-polyprenyl-3-methyl-5-hydroxy-6-metoxy-1,4-benzoquinol methylase
VSTTSSYDTRTPSRRLLDYVEFGPGLVDDIDRRVIGDTRRRKVLDLGCGAGHTAVGLARRGARVITTDSDAEQVAAARALAAEHDVAIEFHNPVRPRSPLFEPIRSISPYRWGH